MSGLVDHVDGAAIPGGVVDTHLAREHTGPCPDGLPEPGTGHVAALDGQPPRARAGNWGPSPRRWR